MLIAIALLALTVAVLVPLLLSERRRRLVHELAAHEALHQLEHEAQTGVLDRLGRKGAVRQRVERHLFVAGKLGRGHMRALKGLYK